MRCRPTHGDSEDYIHVSVKACDVITVDESNWNSGYKIRFKNLDLVASLDNPDTQKEIHVYHTQIGNTWLNKESLIALRQTDDKNTAHFPDYAHKFDSHDIHDEFLLQARLNRVGPNFFVALHNVTHYHNTRPEPYLTLHNRQTITVQADEADIVALILEANEWLLHKGGNLSNPEHILYITKDHIQFFADGVDMAAFADGTLETLTSIPNLTPIGDGRKINLALPNHGFESDETGVKWQLGKGCVQTSHTDATTIRAQLHKLYPNNKWYHPKSE